MKRELFLLTIVLTVSAVQAQPKQRRSQQQQQQTEQQQKKKNPSSAMSMRAQISFPTAVDMPEEVVWRRDIYRELDLTKDENAGLYYPVEPQGKEVNLFTYIFKLAQNGYIPVYEYPTDGSDVFSDEAKVQMRTILDNYHIYYEEQDGKLKVDNSDIPSSEVRKYYLKESAYYDQANASFHIKVLALCPVMMRDDDFGGEATQYPLFWVKYSDLEPFLTRQTVMTSSLNNAATMSMDDYFTLNMYRGKIYKTNNAQGKTLMQLCNGDTTKLSAEQKRIEKELEAFRKNIFGDPEKKDSLDSIAKLDVKAAKAKTKSKSSSASSSSSSRRTKASKPKSISSSSSSSSGSARVTVRRQRH
jgi:gliding motility associated protien GldN